MQITDIKTYVLKMDFKVKIGSMPRLQASGLFTNLKTDEGIDRWALSHWNLSNLAQKQFIDEALRRLVLHKDPFMVEEIFHDSPPDEPYFKRINAVRVPKTALTWIKSDYTDTILQTARSVIHS